MSWEIISCVATVVGVLITLAGTIHHNSTRIAKIEVKIDTVWDFIMKRALTEAVVRGLGTTNSDIVLTEETKEWFVGVAKELKDFYKKMFNANQTLMLKEFERFIFIEINRKFGDKLIKEVAIPHGLISGACLSAAVAIAKEQ